MNRTAYDRKDNPAAIIAVMPVYKGQKLPVAVFVKHADTPYFWQQYSRNYWYRKCAVNYAQTLEALHFAYVFPENSGFDYIREKYQTEQREA